TNGNIWFAATGFAHSINLASTGRGPVIATWNDDLSSYYYGGVFVQHKTDPERVVIEWQTETYSEEGGYAPNDLEAVLYPNGNMRLNYKPFSGSRVKDFGSGISQGAPKKGAPFFVCSRSGIAPAMVKPNLLK
ncbi:MAG TPA: hypothetical protein DDY22_09645, partial [Geobacter sp.]|nr:hypothetical protein [Geobacter sp.]